MLTQKEIDEILKIKGKIRGESAKDNFRCVEILKGKEGLEKYKKRLKELGFPDIKQIKDSEWFPLSYDTLSLVVAADLFGWKEKEIRDFGKCIVKVSFIQKTLIKYFLSLKRVAMSVSEHWKRFMGIGELKLIELNEKEKYFIVRLSNFKTHIYYCYLLAGYFEAVFTMAVKSEKVWIEETQCSHKGGPYHEFIVRYK